MGLAAALAAALSALLSSSFLSSSRSICVRGAVEKRIAIGYMGALGFKLRQEAVLETLAADVLKSSEIEGEHLDPEQVRSSIARRLGIDIGALTRVDRQRFGQHELHAEVRDRRERGAPMLLLEPCVRRKMFALTLQQLR